MITEELKPCPFCGGEACLIPEEFCTTGYWIRCNSCDIEQGKVRDTIDKAIDAWNRRTNDDQVQP